ncbi:MAG: hypothetical protein ACE5FD_03105 [Anaerolineae bacterium]
MAYCTNSEVKAHIGNISGIGDDELIIDIITYAQAFIDRYTHRTFAAGSDTSRTFDSVRDVAGLTLLFDEDLAAITSVINGDGTTVTSSEYVTEPRNAVDIPYYGLTLLRSAGINWLAQDDGDNENAITVTGKWAWSTTPPDDVKHACIELSAYIYKSRDAGPDQDRAIVAEGIFVAPSAIPNRIKEILRPYIKSYL